MAERILLIDELAYGYEKKELTVSKKLNLRSSPSLEGKIVRVMPVGEKVTVLYDDGEWAATEDGFCMIKFLK